MINEGRAEVDWFVEKHAEFELAAYMIQNVPGAQPAVNESGGYNKTAGLKVAFQPMSGNSANMSVAIHAKECAPPYFCPPSPCMLVELDYTRGPPAAVPGTLTLQGYPVCGSAFGRKTTQRWLEPSRIVPPPVQPIDRTPVAPFFPTAAANTTPGWNYIDDALSQRTAAATSVLPVGRDHHNERYVLCGTPPTILDTQLIDASSKAIPGYTEPAINLLCRYCFKADDNNDGTFVSANPVGPTATNCTKFTSCCVAEREEFTSTALKPSDSFFVKSTDAHFARCCPWFDSPDEDIPPSGAGRCRLTPTGVMINGPPSDCWDDLFGEGIDVNAIRPPKEGTAPLADWIAAATRTHLPLSPDTTGITTRNFSVANAFVTWDGTATTYVQLPDGTYGTDNILSSFPSGSPTAYDQKISLVTNSTVSTYHVLKELEDFFRSKDVKFWKPLIHPITYYFPVPNGTGCTAALQPYTGGFAEEVAGYSVDGVYSCLDEFCQALATTIGEGALDKLLHSTSIGLVGACLTRLDYYTQYNAGRYINYGKRPDLSCKNANTSTWHTCNCEVSISSWEVCSGKTIYATEQNSDTTLRISVFTSTAVNKPYSNYPANIKAPLNPINSADNKPTWHPAVGAGNHISNVTSGISDPCGRLSRPPTIRAATINDLPGAITDASCSRFHYGCGDTVSVTPSPPVYPRASLKACSLPTWAVGGDKFFDMDKQPSVGVTDKLFGRGQCKDTTGYCTWRATAAALPIYTKKWETQTWCEYVTNRNVKRTATQNWAVPPTGTRCWPEMCLEDADCYPYGFLYRAKFVCRRNMCRFQYGCAASSSNLDADLDGDNMKYAYHSTHMQFAFQPYVDPASTRAKFFDVAVDLNPYNPTKNPCEPGSALFMYASTYPLSATMGAACMMWCSGDNELGDNTCLMNYCDPNPPLQCNQVTAADLAATVLDSVPTRPGYPLEHEVHTCTSIGTPLDVPMLDIDSVPNRLLTVPADEDRSAAYDPDTLCDCNNANPIYQCGDEADGSKKCAWSWDNAANGAPIVGLFLGSTQGPRTLAYSDPVDTPKDGTQKLIDNFLGPGAPDAQAIGEIYSKLPNTEKIPGVCLKWPYGHVHPANVNKTTWGLSPDGSEALYTYCKMYDGAYAHCGRDRRSYEERNAWCTAHPDWDQVRAGYVFPLNRTSACSKTPSSDWYCLYVRNDPAYPSLGDVLADAPHCSKHSCLPATLIVSPIDYWALRGFMHRESVHALGDSGTATAPTTLAITDAEAELLQSPAASTLSLLQTLSGRAVTYSTKNSKAAGCPAGKVAVPGSDGIAPGKTLFCGVGTDLDTSAIPWGSTIDRPHVTLVGLNGKLTILPPSPRLKPPGPGLAVSAAHVAVPAVHAGSVEAIAAVRVNSEPVVDFTADAISTTGVNTPALIVAPAGAAHGSVAVSQLSATATEYAVAVAHLAGTVDIACSQNCTGIYLHGGPTHRVNVSASTAVRWIDAAALTHTFGLAEERIIYSRPPSHYHMLLAISIGLAAASLALTIIIFLVVAQGKRIDERIMAAKCGE